MRRYLMAGNWKMNLTPSEAKKFALELAANIKDLDKDVDVMIAPNFASLAYVKEAIAGTPIKLGAQNMNDNECMRHIKSTRYLESDNYRKMLEFIESDTFQVIILGHSCGNSDRTLLNTLFEHRNCVSVKSDNSS